MNAWSGESSLKQDFPNVFAMASDLNAVVTSYLSTHGGEVVWMPSLKRGAFDWEIPRVTQFLTRLNDSQVYLGHKDHQE